MRKMTQATLRELQKLWDELAANGAPPRPDHEQWAAQFHPVRKPLKRKGKKR